ncbi:hypothetical protein CDAR_189361 [Caerostris darwini]|uniref:Uncharacterized protein n=1 Tax=Caerostris darwini TaxID=1538125 RepID=A0AAV4PN89_9ARAC|nr:hypothetical protein CDAR_189361 [Caerostris darwini]
MTRERPGSQSHSEIPGMTIQIRILESTPSLDCPQGVVVCVRKVSLIRVACSAGLNESFPFSHFSEEILNLLNSKNQMAERRFKHQRAVCGEAPPRIRAAAASLSPHHECPSEGRIIIRTIIPLNKSIKWIPVWFG